MKKLFKPLLCLLFAASMVSCSNSDEVIDEQVVEVKRPFVNYEIVPGDDPFTFEFKNSSENYQKLEWRFGDDSLSSDVSPEHVYLATGKYEVTLTATSETGATARKLIVVNIDPDQVLQVSAAKTGQENEVKFKFDTDAEVADVQWEFSAENTTNDESPVMTYGEGTLNPFKLKVTTPKGSVVELNKFATTEGVVSDVTNQVSLAVSADNSGGPNANEGSSKIIDNNINTKLYMGWPGSYWAQFTFPGPQTIKFYGIGTANDWGTRLAKDWTLQGSNDGVNWEVIDTRAGVSPGEVYFKMFYYAVENPKPYMYYKWNVTANNGDGGWQLSEFRLFK